MKANFENALTYPSFAEHTRTERFNKRIIPDQIQKTVLAALRIQKKQNKISNNNQLTLNYITCIY